MKTQTKLKYFIIFVHPFEGPVSVKDKKIAGKCLGPLLFFFPVCNPLTQLGIYPPKKKNLPSLYIADVKVIIKSSFFPPSFLCAWESVT